MYFIDFLKYINVSKIYLTSFKVYNEMKFLTMILLTPLKVRLKTKPFTVCQYLVWIQSYEGIKLLKL